MPKARTIPRILAGIAGARIAERRYAARNPLYISPQPTHLTSSWTELLRYLKAFADNLPKPEHTTGPRRPYISRREHH